MTPRLQFPAQVPVLETTSGNQSALILNFFEFHTWCATGACQLQMAKEGVPWTHGPLTMPSAVRTAVAGMQVR